MALSRIRTATVAATAAVVATALATAGGLLITSSPAGAVAAPATTTDPVAAAAGWLAQQFVDSSHKPAPSGDHFEGSFPSGGTTVYYFDGGRQADAVFALAAAKAGKSKIDAAIAYFQQHVDEYTSVSDTSGKPGPSDGQVGKTALAAIVAGADPTSFGGFNLLQSLKTDECTAQSGSTTDFTVPTCPAAGAARNIFASVSESLAILAEVRGAAGFGNQYAPSTAAVSYLLSLQCTDGGFTIDTAGGSGCTSDVDATGYAAAALAALGNQQSALAKADAWLASQQNPAGYWVAQGGPDVDSTGLATAALAASGADVTTARGWLVTQQMTTGPTVGAGASRGALKFQGAFNASSSVKATDDGLLGMASGGWLATLTASNAAAGTQVLALTGSAEKSPVSAGAAQLVSGLGFAAGENVSAVLHSGAVALGTVKASTAGTATVSFTVPSTLPAGAHTVVLTGQSSGLGVSVPFTVLAPAAGGTTGSGAGSGVPLANTGRDGQRVDAELAVGLALLLAGAGAVYAGRRRRA